MFLWVKLSKLFNNKKEVNIIINLEKICSIFCENKFFLEFVFNDLNFEINKS